MKAELWYLIVGALLLVVAVSGSAVKRLPLTPTMLYLALGVIVGPLGFGLFRLDPMGRARLLEHVTEVAVIVSLFTTGLKLRVPLRDKLWSIPIRLAFGSMTITVGLVALVGVYGLGLPIGAAVLLGAVLAPTDPVLASEVQLESAADSDRLRFSITGEAGLNDGTAFPFVLLGLALMGLHEVGASGWRWVMIDVVWATAGGLAIGTVAGMLVGRLVIYLRREHREGFGLDEFLALGLIAMVYGAAVAAHTYGFLAVFAAGLALRALERRHSGQKPAKDVQEMAMTGKREELAVHPEKAPAHMAEALLGFNEQIERVLEVGIVLLIGAMLTPELMRWQDLWVVGVLLLVIRPVAVVVGLTGSGAGIVHLALISWFGIRGVGSLYYLMFAISRGVDSEIATRLIAITLSAVAVSIIVHGISAMPLMKWYRGARPPK